MPTHSDDQKVDFDHESIAADIKVPVELARSLDQRHGIYAEAIARYPNDEAIDQCDEERLKRKLDKRILPLLGACYFFYVSSQSIDTRTLEDKLIEMAVCRQNDALLCSDLWNQG